MSRLRAWGMATALTVGAIAPSAAFADDSPTTTTDTRPLYKRLFSSPKPAPAPAARYGAVAAPPGQQPIGQPLSPDAVRAALQAEQDAYLRRTLACVKLQEAALQRNDDALYRQAEELQRQADAIYKQRITALGLSPAVRAPLPKTENAFAASFDLAPEKPVDPKAAAAKLVAPAAPVPVSGGTTAEVREVKP